MCIISGPVHNVSSTKIFVLPNVDFSRQMTMYSNSVDSPVNNLMILPVPNPYSIQFHDIEYDSIFQDLKRSVYTNSFGVANSSSIITKRFLEVFEHGSYLVSVAKTVDELFQLDTSIFHLTSDLYKFFNQNYNDEFGYICCVLKPGLQNYEPLCYSHALHGDKLFVPTLHYHVHENGSRDTYGADWDHYIYSAATKNTANYSYKSYPENLIDWSFFPPEYRWKKNNPIRCMEIKGKARNRDIFLDIQV